MARRPRRFIKVRRKLAVFYYISHSVYAKIKPTFELLRTRTRNDELVLVSQ